MEWKDGLVFETRDPADVDYVIFDFASLTNGTGRSDWLASGETISSYTATVDSGLTKDSDETVNTATGVRVWYSGGTAGTSYTITCAITTSDGREASRSIEVFTDDL